MPQYIITKARQVIRIIPPWILKKLSNHQFLIIASIFVGLWAGLTAVLLKVSVHYLQESLKPFGQNYSWVYFVSPTIGILSTYLFIKFILKGDLDRGTSHVLLSIAKKSSFLPRKEVIGHVVTSALTVGMGGSAGLESPIVQTGSAIGSTFASFFPIGYRDRTLLLACGAAAGIATAFNAPIAGVLFALEVLLVDVSISAFIPLIIAGATGALCSKIILSEGILLSFKQVSDFNYYNVPYYILLGLVCGLVSIFYKRITIKIEVIFAKYFSFGLLRLVVGCLFLGGLIILFPSLFGEGYTSITALAFFKPEQLFTGSPLYSMITDSTWTLGFAILTLGLVKVFAVAFTLNAGGNGGNFAPSLLVGASFGFSFAYLFNSIGVTILPTANFTLVAMAGVLTGIFHAPLTAIFLIAEITGGYDLIIPLMIVSALSTAVSRYTVPHSLDEAKLAKAGQAVGFSKDRHVLSALSIKDFIETDFISIPLQSNLGSLVEAIAKSKRNIFPVIDKQHILVGIIVLENIREIMFDTTQYHSITVDQLMQKPLVTVNNIDDMELVMEKFDKTGAWNIPVLNEGKYVGFVSKSRIFSNYRDKLIKE